MFSGKQEALDHRDAVVEVLVEAYGESEHWHVHPVLDGATVRVPKEELHTGEIALEEAGFPVQRMGESGDWFELKAKQKPNDE